MNHQLLGLRLSACCRLLLSVELPRGSSFSGAWCSQTFGFPLISCSLHVNLWWKRDCNYRMSDRNIMSASMLFDLYVSRLLGLLSIADSFSVCRIPIISLDKQKTVTAWQICSWHQWHNFQSGCIITSDERYFTNCAWYLVGWLLAWPGKSNSRELQTKLLSTVHVRVKGYTYELRVIGPKIGLSVWQLRTIPVCAQPLTHDQRRFRTACESYETWLVDFGYSSEFWAAGNREITEFHACISHACSCPAVWDSRWGPL